MPTERLINEIRHFCHAAIQWEPPSIKQSCVFCATGWQAIPL